MSKTKTRARAAFSDNSAYITSVDPNVLLFGGYADIVKISVLHEFDALSGKAGDSNIKGRVRYSFKDGHSFTANFQDFELAKACAQQSYRRAKALGASLSQINNAIEKVFIDFSAIEDVQLNTDGSYPYLMTCRMKGLKTAHPDDVLRFASEDARKRTADRLVAENRKQDVSFQSIRENLLYDDHRKKVLLEGRDMIIRASDIYAVLVGNNIGFDRGLTNVGSHKVHVLYGQDGYAVLDFGADAEGARFAASSVSRMKSGLTSGDGESRRLRLDPRAFSFTGIVGNGVYVNGKREFPGDEVVIGFEKRDLCAYFKMRNPHDADLLAQTVRHNMYQALVLPKEPSNAVCLPLGLRPTA